MSVCCLFFELMHCNRPFLHDNKSSVFYLFPNLTLVAKLISFSLMQYTIEEKVIERAYKKLALDALVIQQGRLAEQKSKFIIFF